MRTLLFSFLTIVVFSNCAGIKQNKWLSAHRTELARLANSNMPTEEKVDGMMTAYAQLMDEGLRFANPIKGVKYIEKFRTQNEGSIDKILAESNTWMNGVNTQEGIMLGIRVAQKPYIKTFIDLAPRFKRKYETYKFIAQMTGKVAGGFGKIGSKVIGAF
jgi:hypothetical protein